MSWKALRYMNTLCIQRGPKSPFMCEQKVLRNSSVGDGRRILGGWKCLTPECYGVRKLDQFFFGGLSLQTRLVNSEWDLWSTPSSEPWNFINLPPTLKNWSGYPCFPPLTYHKELHGVDTFELSGTPPLCGTTMTGYHHLFHLFSLFTDQQSCC